MARGDLVQHAAVDAPVEVVDVIGTQERRPHVRQHLVPQFLEGHGRRQRVAPQQIDHLAVETRPPAVLDEAGDHRLHQREEPVTIGHPVDHEPRETIRGVEDDEASLGLGCRHVDACREQSVMEERAY